MEGGEEGRRRRRKKEGQRRTGVRKRGRLQGGKRRREGDGIGGEGVTGEYWISAQVALRVPSVY